MTRLRVEFVAVPTKLTESTEVVQERALGEGGKGKGQDEDDEGQATQENASPAERTGGGYFGMAPHGWDEEQQSPESPADPEEDAEKEKNRGRETGGPAMGAGRQGVEKMAAIELAGGDEVERGDEEAHPAGDEDGMAECVFEGWGVEKRGEGGEGERGAEVDDAGGVEGRCGFRAGDADDAGDDRGAVAGDGSPNADVNQGSAVRDAALDANDGPGGAAERRCRQYPGQRSADAVGATGKVVSELVREQDEEQGG